MQQLIFILHLLVAISLIAFILMSRGKGSDVGAAFGSGSSHTMLGARGAMPLLVKITGVLGLLFFVTSLLLGYFTSRAVKETNSMNIQIPATSIPASVPGSAPAPTNLPVPEKR